MRKDIDELARFGVNGYARGSSRDGARRVLTDMVAAGVLDRDVVLSALSAYNVAPPAQLIIADLITQVNPALTHF